MARLLAGATLALALAGGFLAPANAARQGSYAFTQHDVRVHQLRLNYAFRHLQVFRDLGVQAYCSGEAKVRLVSGSMGFFRIRCTTNANMLDFLYTLDKAGREHMKRVQPR